MFSSWHFCYRSRVPRLPEKNMTENSRSELVLLAGTGMLTPCQTHDLILHILLKSSGVMPQHKPQLDPCRQLLPLGLQPNFHVQPNRVPPTPLSSGSGGSSSSRSSDSVTVDYLGHAAWLCHGHLERTLVGLNLIRGATLPFGANVATHKHWPQAQRATGRYQE